MIPIDELPPAIGFKTHIPKTQKYIAKTIIETLLLTDTTLLINTFSSIPFSSITKSAPTEVSAPKKRKLQVVAK